MKSFAQRFKTLLTEQDRMEAPQSDPVSSPDIDPSAERQAFDDQVDPDVDSSEYDTEGWGEEVNSAVDDTTSQVIQWADEIENFTKRLVDPQNPDALLTKLASVTNIPEFQTAAEAVAKHLRKAVSEIGGAKTELDVLASLSGTRRDARQAADQASSGASGAILINKVMNDSNDKPKNTMELLFEHMYGKPEVISELGHKVVPTGNGSRPANSYVLKNALAAAKKYLQDAGGEINQLPTDISKRAYEQYELALRAMDKLKGLL